MLQGQLEGSAKAVAMVEVGGELGRQGGILGSAFTETRRGRRSWKGGQERDGTFGRRDWYV